MRGFAGVVSLAAFTDGIREEQHLNSTSTTGCPSSFTNSPETVLIIPLND